MQDRQAVMDLDTAWHHEQLAEAHEVCDKLAQQNDFLRAELAKRGVVVEGDEEHSFALGGVPDQPQHSAVSFSDTASASPSGTFDRKRAASEMEDIIAGMRPALLNMVRESDAACDELQQMIDRLQGQLSTASSRSPPNISPFAKVAVGTKEEQLQATKLLCSEAGRQAVEVRTRLACLIEALQQPAEVILDGAEHIAEEHVQVPPPEQSFDFSGPRLSFQVSATRQSHDSASDQSVDLQPKAKPSVSFQTLNQPAYSANLDSFLPGSRKLGQELSGFDNDFDTSQLDNPLFGATLSREHVQGTRGVALTRASVAAQMFQNMAQDENNVSTASQEQLAHAVRAVQQQVSDAFFEGGMLLWLLVVGYSALYMP